MHRCSVIVPILTMSLAFSVTAQVAPGDRIRVLAPTLGFGPTEGTLGDIGPIDLSIVTDQGAVRRIPLARLTELRREDGTKRRLGRGLLLGYLGGATVGSIVGGATVERDADRQAVAAAGALVGLVVGGILGQSHQTTRWAVVSLGAIRPQLQPGTRIRVRGLDGGTTLGEGDLIALTADRLLLQPRSGPALRLRRDRIGSVEWPYLTRPATGRGIASGAATGVAIGLMAAGAADDCSSGGYVCFSREEIAVAAGVTFGAAGALVGGVVGSLRRVTEWESAGPSETWIRIAPAISADRIGVFGSVRF